LLKKETRYPQRKSANNYFSSNNHIFPY